MLIILLHLPMEIHLYVLRFGYVEFSSMRKAKDALDNMNGLELDGREVRLDFAKGPRGGGGGGGGGDDRRGARGGGGRGEAAA